MPNKNKPDIEAGNTFIWILVKMKEMPAETA
jgi:hypothetical protein